MVLITAGESDQDHRRRENYHRPTAEIDNHNLIMASSFDSGNSRGTLSNFTSLPFFNIKWGRQKHLRCVKYSQDQHFSTSLTRSQLNSVDGFHHRKRLRSTDNDDGGIQAMGEKLMLDFRRQAAQMQAAFLNKSDAVSPPPHSPEFEVAAAAAAVESRPWNLRTRRSVCKEPNNNASLFSEKNPSFSPAKVIEVKSPAKRSGGDGDSGEGRREKFSGSLSKKEIEEDFVAIMGARPARRPKKRLKGVQRQIDAIIPGFWLSEITADMYKVNEHP